MLPFRRCSGTTSFLDCFPDTVVLCRLFRFQVPKGIQKRGTFFDGKPYKWIPSPKITQRNPEPSELQKPPK